VIKVIALLACGIFLGVAGVVAWLVCYINKEGGLFR